MIDTLTRNLELEDFAYREAGDNMSIIRFSPAW